MIYFQNHNTVKNVNSLKYNNIFLDIDVDENEENKEIMEDQIQILTNNLELYKKK